MLSALRGESPVSDPSFPLGSHRAPGDRFDAPVPGSDCSTAIGGACGHHSPPLVQSLRLSEDHILGRSRPTVGVDLHYNCHRIPGPALSLQDMPRHPLDSRPVAYREDSLCVRILPTEVEHGESVEPALYAPGEEFVPSHRTPQRTL